MNLPTKIAIGSGLSLIAIATLAYLNKQAKALYDACFTVAGAVVHTISFDNMEFDVLMSIQNKSDMSFTITSQNYNIYVNKMLVAEVANNENVKIASNGQSNMKINVKFNPQDLLKKGIENITALLKNKDSLVVEIKGNISIGAGIVSFKNYKVDERLLMKELLSPSKKTNKC
ncbi:MAG: LEA type 2 family protein [Bacteroidales bacterium]|nr:LEA type 2 family protein [Bacteroidales bacterium]